MQLNPSVIPDLAVCFVRGKDLPGFVIGLVRGGWSGANDLSFATHAGFMVKDGRYQFVEEEGPKGFVENGATEYLDNPRIVGMYYWKGFDNPDTKQAAIDRLDEIRENQSNKKIKSGKYNWLGLLKFVPLINKIPVVKKWADDPDRDWCSECCASIMKASGAEWITDTELAPDQLAALMQRREKSNGDVRCILDYYVNGGQV